eukprot:NODE_1221_length_1829_cov_100.698710_g1159_i0.p1 GENE.NODE_1221_length_1829_cov_100.698710_g1159_i0~~NODE_1221_length_1829_cov_100.698710_g1159_i0.p1  ORF type:complete len:577 (-),score=78.21 NODE_1221_length_1829_cov_100.698710_g1159_i0:97-1728(-)
MPDGIRSSMSEEVEFETRVDIPDTIQALWQREHKWNALTVEWKAPLPNGSPILRYEVECTHQAVTGEAAAADWNQEIVEAPPSQTEHRMERLDENQLYVFRVRAVNALGPAEWSVPADLITDRCSPEAPGIPQLVRMTGERAYLRWDPPPDVGPPVVKYYLQLRHQSSSEWIRECSEEPQITICSLQSATMYSFRVYCENATGNFSDFSPVANFTTDSCRPDRVRCPEIIRWGSRDIALLFERPNSNASPITRYHIRSRVPDQEEWRDEYMDVVDTPPRGAELVTLQHTVDTLVPNRFYQFIVRAENSHGWGAYSERALGQTQCTRPEQPPPMALVRAGTEFLKLKCTHPEMNGLAAFHYRVQFRRKGEHEWTSETWNALSTPHVCENPVAIHYSKFRLPAATEFDLRFACENEAGWSDWSEVTTFATENDVPSVPEGLTIHALRLPVTVGWLTPSSNGRPITRYQVKCTPEDNDLKEVLITPASKAVDHLPAKGAMAPQCRVEVSRLVRGRYTVVVRAENGMGWSDWSEPVLVEAGMDVDTT